MNNEELFWIERSFNQEKTTEFFKTYSLGGFLGEGSYKKVFASGDDLAVAVCSDERIISEELDSIFLLEKVGIRVVEVIDYLLSGIGIIVMRRVCPPEETIDEEGLSVSYSMLDVSHRVNLSSQVKKISDILGVNQLYVYDLQCMIDANWNVIVHDPLEVQDRGYETTHSAIRCDTLRCGLIPSKI